MTRDSSITRISTKTYIEIASVGATLLKGDMRLYATKEDFAIGKLMNVSDTLHKKCIRVADILYSIDALIGNKDDSTISREDNITSMYRYKFNEEKGVVERVRPWLPFDLTIGKYGYSFSQDLINEVEVFKSHTFATKEKCLAARNVEVVCFDGEDGFGEDEEKELNTLVLTAKGDRAKKLAETIGAMLQTSDVEVFFE